MAREIAEGSEGAATHFPQSSGILCDGQPQINTAEESTAYQSEGEGQKSQVSSFLTCQFTALPFNPEEDEYSEDTSVLISL